MARMITNGWVLTGSDSENTAAAQHLGIGPPEEIGLVEFVDRINKNTAK